VDGILGFFRGSGKNSGSSLLRQSNIPGQRVDFDRAE